MFPVPPGKKISDEVFNFFFIEIVEQCGGHEGDFGDVAFGNFGAGDAPGFVGLGDVSGEVNFLVVAAGFTAKKNGAVFEGDGHGGMLLGDDEGGLQDLGEQAVGFEFATDGSEVRAEGSALTFEEVAGGTEFPVEGFTTAEGTSTFR